jgi:hypothetical protein
MKTINSIIGDFLSKYNKILIAFYFISLIVFTTNKNFLSWISNTFVISAGDKQLAATITIVLFSIVLLIVTIALFSIIAIVHEHVTRERGG